MANRAYLHSGTTQQSPRDRLMASRQAQKASGMSNKDILRQGQGVSSGYSRQTPSQPRPSNDPQLGTQTTAKSPAGIINMSSLGPSRDTVQLHGQPTSAAGIYEQRLGDIDESGLASDVRSDFQPGIDAVTGALEEGRDVARRGAGRGRELAEQGYADATQLSDEQRAANERNRQLAAERTGTTFDELMSQTELERTDAERALVRRRAESKLYQDEARAGMEKRLPEALERTKGFLAERGLLSTTATSKELAKVETQQLADLNYLDRQGAIDMQEISSLEADLTRRYGEKLTNYQKMKTDELTGIENKALDEISRINQDQRLSQLDKNREIARITQSLEETQNQITTQIAQAEQENEVAVRQEITQRRQEAINQAKELAGFEIDEPERQLRIEKGQFELDLEQKYAEQERQLGLDYNENVNRQLEGAITGYDPQTGEPTFDNVKFQETVKQFAENLGYNYDALDENKRSSLAQEMISRFNANTSRMSAEAAIAKALSASENDSTKFLGMNVDQYAPEEMAQAVVEMLESGTTNPLEIYKLSESFVDDNPNYDLVGLSVRQAMDDQGYGWYRVQNLSSGGERTEKDDMIDAYWLTEETLTKLSDSALDFESKIGPIAGNTAATVSAVFGDKELATLKAELQNIKSPIRNALYGANLTEVEVKNFEKMLGDTDQPAENLIVQMETLMKNAKVKTNDKIGLASNSPWKRYQAALDFNADVGDFDANSMLPSLFQKKNNVAMSYQDISQVSKSAPSNHRGSLDIGAIPYSNRTHCGMYVNDVTNAGVGNSYKSKKAVAGGKTPVAGAIFAKPTNDKWGHTGVVEDVIEDSSGNVTAIQIAHANSKGTASDNGKGGNFERKIYSINSPYLQGMTFSGKLI